LHAFFLTAFKVKEVVDLCLVVVFQSIIDANTESLAAFGVGLVKEVSADLRAR
jgi:hypothetical protein